jgi:hypothetical protein
MEFFHDPTALTENLFPVNFDAPYIWSAESPCIIVRPYQMSMQNYSSMYADDPELSGEENFLIKKGAGDGYHIAARGLGKSWWLIIDTCLSIIYNIGQGLVASDCAKHLEKVTIPITQYAESHPFLKIFHLKQSRAESVKRNPLTITTQNGTIINSANENADSKNPGEQFHGPHPKIFYFEEFSYTTDEGQKKAIDTRSSYGRIERFSGIPDVSLGSPLGKILKNPNLKNWVWRLPQAVKEEWSEKMEQELAELHGGKNCFDDKTEVLTKRGWQTINTILESDEVLSMNPKNQYAEYYPIKHIFKYDYSGKLNYFEGLKLNFAITDNHQLLYQTWKKPYPRLNTLKDIINHKSTKEHQTVTEIKSQCLNCGKILKKGQKRFCSRGCENKYYHSSDFAKSLIKPYILNIFNWKGKNFKTFKFEAESPNAKKFTINAQEWFQFLGWFLSEGSLASTKRKKSNGEIYYSYSLGISQTKKENLLEISDMLKKMGFSGNYNKSSASFMINSRAIYEHLKENCYSGENIIRVKTIHNCYTKKVPEYVKFANKKLINIFLNAFNKGDGDSKRTKYYTTSKHLVNDLQELIFKIGHFCNFNKRKNSNLFDLSEGRCQKYGSICDFRRLEKKSYTGIIWCLEVEPYHNFFVRREGKCHFTGNSSSYKLNVMAETIEGAFGFFDMARLQEASLNRSRQIKHFEISKEQFNGFEDRLIVEKLPGTITTFIAADIGTGAAPTEIIVIFYDGKKYHCVYNITLYRLIQNEQAKVFKFLYDKLGGAFVAVDATHDNGVIIDELYEMGVPQDNLLKVKFNENIEVGFEKTTDQNGNESVVLDKEGNPVPKLVYTELHSFKELENLLYGGNVDVWYDEKFINQFTDIIAKQSGMRLIFDTKGINHETQAWQVWSICRFMNEYNQVKNSYKSQNKRGWCA